MSTALATLPTSSDHSQWSPEEVALVEAAGLVHTDSQSGKKTLAERPVVAAFLQHCVRTGLDPIARQIYSIARKSRGQLKWQIQISIDGARLVAERSGQYEGQTTPEFTGDGITWTQVWLSNDPPKAARVGVYRRGFRDALYAVALWDAYVQTKYDGSVSDMWSKMGPLMLAKCAEMLALRKAFPQDLSGLYSSEEMAQADSPPAAKPAEPEWAQVAPPEQRVASKDWAAAIAVAGDVGELRAVYAEIEAAAEVGLPLDPQHADSLAALVAAWGLEQPPATVSSGQLIGAVKRAMEAAPVEAVVVDEQPAAAEQDAGPVQEWTTAPIPGAEQATDASAADEEPF
ncbi:phage recombination protein Bet [Herbiconiux sp. KACC 21604]|uniref:phage recombination protein Bet n=1 Tax=unclassified Herbiconiux TaxID=2618217 RepID=UPI001490A2F8|nr:phage recombination protein Bet [Herbiconiux sp. SALV-R1]QJU54375.1 phage recombination protein Bet [Herbiconiux sp. SALV-R1]WPO85446.1 phage recombination protein Bet [Herbiconiux sp. KACC 21604]